MIYFYNDHKISFIKETDGWGDFQIGKEKFINKADDFVYASWDERDVLTTNFMENFRKDYPYFPDDEDIDRICYYKGYRNNGMENGWSGSRVAKLAFLFMSNPQIEALAKLKVFDEILREWTDNPKNPVFNRCFKKGNNISAITGLDKSVWKAITSKNINMKTYNAFRVWDGSIKKEIRKENKARIAQGLKPKREVGLTAQDIEEIYGMKVFDVEELRKVIRDAKNENDKPYFTIKSLVAYLERLDMYQAIGQTEAIMLINDYLRMCKALKVHPVFDTDSLKREHDVMARNHNLWLRAKREEFERQQGSLFKEEAEKLQKYEYSESVLSVIVPKTVTDLINEGHNNRNCVGSYVESFARGKSKVFFIRHTDDMERSYITIELSSNLNSVRQAYYAGNRPIHKQSDLSFIVRWLKHIKEVK